MFLEVSVKAISNSGCLCYDDSGAAISQHLFIGTVGGLCVWYAVSLQL